MNADSCSYDIVALDFEEPLRCCLFCTSVCDFTKPKGPSPIMSLNSDLVYPSAYCLKINAEGALDSRNGFGRVGHVARNMAGSIVYAAKFNFKGFFSPLVIEAMGFRFAIIKGENFM